MKREHERINDDQFADGTAKSDELLDESRAGSKLESPRRFIPVTEWPMYHPWPSVKGLRWLIYKGCDNGFERVVRRVGRRVLIDETAFLEWIVMRTELDGI